MKTKIPKQVIFCVFVHSEIIVAQTARNVFDAVTTCIYQFRIYGCDAYALWSAVFLSIVTKCCQNFHIGMPIYTYAMTYRLLWKFVNVSWFAVVDILAFFATVDIFPVMTSTL